VVGAGGAFGDNALGVQFAGFAEDNFAIGFEVLAET
jgi:hypothetical protein